MTVYDRRDWVKQVFSLHGSVLPLIAPKVLVLSLLAWGLAWLEHQAHLPELPIAPFTVLGTALGLLLTFRTNSCYDRFWEGRKAWGGIVNRSRNLARQAAMTFPDGETRAQVAALIVAFVHSVKRHLWKDTQVPELRRLVGDAEAQWLAVSPGPTQRSLLRLSEVMARTRAEGRVDSIDQKRWEDDLTYLIDQLGVCERIQRTPIPPGYVLHLRRFLIVYCLGLTLALVDPLGWYAPLVVGFVSYAFLGIERVGIEIEDPFEHTPNDIDMEKISMTIESDVFALLGGHNL